MRKLIWISGSEDWCNTNIYLLTDMLPIQGQHMLYCGAKPHNLACRQIDINSRFRRSNIEHNLGTECSALIVNSFSGFNPELFCALCGTVASPGIILLISPADADWPSYPDPDTLNLCSFPHTQKEIAGRFIKYFIHKLKSSPDSEFIFSISQKNHPAGVTRRIKNQLLKLFSDAPSGKIRPIQMNRQQLQVVNRVRNMLDHDTASVLVLSGKRGRGKSSSLGVALNDYARKSSGYLKVCVVSQTRANVRPLIEHLFRASSDRLSKSLDPSSLAVSCYPPDQLLKQKRKFDLLVVDEAASIPLPQLYRILTSYQKIVLSTTTDGYEGTGLGFNFKLNDHLKSLKHQISRIHLKYSLRWPGNDPVEKFLQSSLLLDQSTFPEIKNTSGQLQPDQMDFVRLDRDHLVCNTRTIEEIYSILSLAHYRTTPDDLRYLLDAPETEIWIARQSTSIYAALMLSKEGRLPENLHDEIWLGFRRLQGHLIPQCLSAQCGFKSAPAFQFKRILRIAVHPGFQNMGIGKMLVKAALENESADENLDFYGVSFGFDKDVFRFWDALGFYPVNLGFRRNARSGARSVMMLNPLSVRAKQFLLPLRRRFQHSLEFALTRPTSAGIGDFACLRDFHPGGRDGAPASSRDKLDIYSFAFGHRQLAHCYPALSTYAIASINSGIRHLLSEKQLKLVSFKILQNMDWITCSALLGYTGKKQALVQLRGVYKKIYTATWGNKS